MAPANALQDPALDLAKTSFESGDLGTAAKYCRSILKENPSHPDALQLLGKVSFVAANSINNHSVSLQAYAEAERAFQKLLQIAPERNETRVQQTLAICLQKRGATIQALQCAKAATKLDPESVNAFRILGECESDLGKTEPAIKALETAHSLAPNDLDVVWLLASAFKAAKRPHKAIALLKKTTSSLPEKSKQAAKLHRLMYENYLASNDSNSALVAIEKVVTLDPGNASAIVEHAATLYRLGRFEEAKSAALKARSMPEKDNTLVAIIALKLGQILVHEQKYEEAIPELESAVRHAPADLPALQALAAALRRTGQEDRARALLKNYQKIRSAKDSLKIHQATYRSQPDNSSAQEKLIRCLIIISDFQEAERQLSIRQLKFPNDSVTPQLTHLLNEAKAR